MGNRAVITTAKSVNENKVGIYLHWNGGPESVLAFLQVAKDRGYRCPNFDGSYAMARLTGIIHEFFGPDQSTSVGVGMIGNLDTDNFDNGVYVIGEGWECIDRWGKGHCESKSYDDLPDGPNGKNQFNGIVEEMKARLDHWMKYKESWNK